MTVDNISEINPGLFVLGAVFILLVFSLLSLGVVRMFEQKFRRGWYYFGGGAVSAVIFYVLLDMWYA